MPAWTKDSPIKHGVSASQQPSGAEIPNINPVTGLSTDYLNHFTEAVMTLEMAGAMPECLQDLKDWRPKTYAEHFAGSRFRNREAVIRAYEAADPMLRRQIEAAAEKLNATLKAIRDTMIRHRSPNADALARRALHNARPLIDRMAALINGSGASGRSDRAGAQAAIDAMFGR